MAAEKETDTSWTDALADFLAGQSGVEAIRLNAGDRRVEVATLGPVDMEALKTQLDEVLRSLDERLLASAPLGHAQGLQMTRQEGALLLQKPTCPTAPRFWKWRDFEWPEPEEMERQSDEEWRALALQAAICGVALVCGWVTERFFQVPLWVAHTWFGIALVSGGWDAAKDAWENLRERRLDVHFLMLAVP